MIVNINARILKAKVGKRSGGRLITNVSTPANLKSANLKGNETKYKMNAKIYLLTIQNKRKFATFQAQIDFIEADTDRQCMILDDEPRLITGHEEYCINLGNVYTEASLSGLQIEYLKNLLARAYK